MLSRIRKALVSFSNDEKDVPVIAAISTGLYPCLLYFSNNYSSVNSIYHVLNFALIFIGIPLLVFLVLFYGFKKSKKLSKYKSHLLFVLLIVIASSLVSQVVFLNYKKNIILILLVSVLLSFKLYKHYKKIIILLFLISFMPVPKLIMKAYFHIKPMTWAALPDDIEQVKLKYKPNIYIIQPDGYASEPVMGSDLYNFKSDLYNWLETNSFKSYPKFRSNYPLTLSSNASLFSMKQHYFGDILFPSLEVPNARSIISGNNPVISILKNNDYKSYFIIELEYFQQNRKEKGYDYYNIKQKEISLFSDGTSLKKDVFSDLKLAMTLDNNSPKFFFIQRLMPHHVHFKAKHNRIEIERDWYINRIKESNSWIQETITHISKEDSTAIIVVLADHGGWVGLKSYDHLTTTNDESKIKSVYSPIASIKWNGFLRNDFDANLDSTVNFFRVLFSVLSDDKSYLNYLEDNSSYKLKKGQFLKSPHNVIDNNGEVVF